jgi:hypothetical protein
VTPLVTQTGSSTTAPSPAEVPSSSK